MLANFFIACLLMAVPVLPFGNGVIHPLVGVSQLITSFITPPVCLQVVQVDFEIVYERQAQGHLSGFKL